MKTLVKVLLTILVIVIIIFLLLFICSRVFGYGTMGNLLSHLGSQLGIMWGRIFS